KAIVGAYRSSEEISKKKYAVDESKDEDLAENEAAVEDCGDQAEQDTTRPAHRKSFAPDDVENPDHEGEGERGERDQPLHRLKIKRRRIEQQKEKPDDQHQARLLQKAREPEQCGEKVAEKLVTERPEGDIGRFAHGIAPKDAGEKLLQRNERKIAQDIFGR